MYFFLFSSFFSLENCVVGFAHILLMKHHGDPRSEGKIYPLDVTFEHNFWTSLFGVAFGCDFWTSLLHVTFGRHFWLSHLNFTFG